MLRARSRRRRARAFLGIALLAGLAIAPHARAEDPRLSEARASYRAGAQAYDAGNFGVAGPAFARADTLAPNETALRLALVSCSRVEDAVLCMNLVERARARDLLADAREAVAVRFTSRASRLVVACADPSSCTARLDGVDLAAGPTWTVPGAHVLELGAGVAAERRSIALEAGASLSVTVPSSRETLPAPRASAAPLAPAPVATPSSPPPPTEPVPQREARGISPVWFWALAGVTVAAGAATTVSGIDTLDQHSAFGRAPSDAAAARGRDAQLRTNVLLAGTGALAIATTLVGTFAVRWGATPREAARR